MFWLLLLACGTGSEVAVEVPQPKPVAHAPPNVLLVVVDTLRKDRMSVYGNARKTTPALERLAKKSMVYDSAFTTAPWTTPSIGSVLTSQLPDALGIGRARSALPEQTQTLAETLQAEGYGTAAVISHTYCGSEWNFQQGFDTFEERNIGEPKSLSSKGITDDAIAFIDKSQGPWFVWTHYFDPHFPYMAHDDKKFRSDDYVGPIKPGVKITKLRQLTKTLSDPDVDQLVAIYDEELAHTDEHIGRLIEHLESTGQLENTLVIFTSDHGEAFMDRGAIGHTDTLNAELTDAPMIVHYPGSTPSGKVPHAVSGVDVFPTVLDVLGLQRPPGLVGRSMRGELTADRPVYSITERGKKLRSVVSAGWKLVRNDAGQVWLYDRTTDPREQRDLADLPEHAAKLADLTKLLDAWPTTSIVEGKEVEASDDERARLEALGYVEGDDH